MTLPTMNDDQRVVLIQSPLLNELQVKLRKDLPKSALVLAAIHNSNCGQFNRRIFTNGWPEFSAVICHYSPVDEWDEIMCYAESSEALIPLVINSGLLNKRKRFYMKVDSTIANMVVEGLKPFCGAMQIQNATYEDFYLPKSIDKCQPCDSPDGFVLRRLEEHHAEDLVQAWPYFDNVQAKTDYFKNLIKYFSSAGIFSQKDPNTPIAWCAEYVYGQPAHLYVKEEFRRRGFATLMMNYICECIEAKGLVPVVAVDPDNNGGLELMRKLGFVKYGRCDYIPIGDGWC